MSDSFPSYRRGDTWRFVITPPSDPVLGAFLPLDDREVWFTVKSLTADAEDDTDALIQIKRAYADLPTLTDGKKLFVVGSDMTNIAPNKYRADIQLVLPTTTPPEVDTLIVDERFMVTKEVTRKIA